MRVVYLVGKQRHDHYRRYNVYLKKLKRTRLILPVEKGIWAYNDFGEAVVAPLRVLG